MKKYIIVAPHADDEVIGCYTLLKSGRVHCVVFPKRESMEEAANSADLFGFSIKHMDDFPFDGINDKIFVFPDPVYDLHPEHRKLGALGEVLLRAGQEVIFYTTNMLAPYIFEVIQPESKRQCLNILYPTKKSLWEYDHRYFLFEGYNQWLINPTNE